MFNSSGRLFLCMLAGVLPIISQAQVFNLTVEAGSIDRNHSIVTFTPPPELAGAELVLNQEGAPPLPVQTWNDKAWFVLPDLKAHSSTVFTLEKATYSSENTLKTSSTNGAVSFSTGGRSILTYQADEREPPRDDIPEIYKRGGYIRSVHTPDGIRVTDDYPTNHIHHHGIWAAWTKTEFEGRTPDFWNMGEGSATVRPVNMDTVFSGPVLAGFSSQHEYVDLSGETPIRVLDETWETRIYDVPLDSEAPYHVFDLDVLHRTSTDKPLHLPEYRYGGVGFRGHSQWNGADSTFFLTSEGKDRSNGHATRARWCHVSGYVDGVLAGIAILGHPDNYRAPQPMRIHPTEPFFNWAPSQAGDWAITPEKPYKVSYRYIVMDGPPDAELIDQLWEDYANPTKVTLSSL